MQSTKGTSIMFKRNRRLIALGTSILALAAVGLVYAAWTTNGSGSGYAAAGQATNLSTNVASTATATKLYPGTNGDVAINIVNSNPYPVTVTAVTLNGTNASITAAGGIGTCSTTGVSFTNQTGLSINVPANGSTQTNLPNAVSMSNASENGCQNATFTIPVNLAGASA